MILLVEDNEDDVFLMRRAMKQLGRETTPMHIAVTGREALDYLQRACETSGVVPLPSIIFLDLKLPFLHGFQVLSWIKEHPTVKAVPVAVLTSSAEPSDRDEAYRLGAKAFLVKPPTSEMLRVVFQNSLGREG